MADDELTESSEGPRRKTFTPPSDDAVFTGSFPVIDDVSPEVPAVSPIPPLTPPPSAAIAPPVRTSLSDADILARFSGETAGSTAEMITELERQVSLREDEEEAFEMWANLTRATRGTSAGEIVSRERIVFDGGTPPPIEVPEREDAGGPLAETPSAETPSAETPPELVGSDDESMAADAAKGVLSGEVLVSGTVSADEEEPQEPEPLESALSEDQVAHDELVVEDPAVENSAVEELAEEHWPLDQTESAGGANEETPAEPTAALAPMIDRIGLEPTPENHRTLTRVGLFWLWFATLTPVVGIVGGSFFVSQGAGVLETAVALGAAAVVSGAIISASAYAGAKTGLSTLHTAQATFGRVANALPSAFLVLIRIAVLGVIVLAAQRLITDVAVAANWWSFDLWILRASAAGLVLAVVITLALLGGRILRIALYSSAGVSVAALAAFAVLTGPTVNASALQSWSADALTVVALGSLALAGVLVLFGHTGGDLARYSRSGRAGSVSAISGLAAVVPTVLFVTYVAWVGASTPTFARALVADPVGALAGQLPPWFPAPVLLGLVVPLVVLGALSLFSGGLAVVSAGVAIPRNLGTGLIAVLVSAGVAAAIIVDHSISQYFPDALYVVGVVLVAWGGTYAADVAFGSHRLDNLVRGSVPAVRVAPLAGFVLAIAAGWGLISSSVGWMSWVGYAFPLLELAGLIDLRDGQPGVLVALVIASVVSVVAAASTRTPRAEVVDG